MKYLISGGAGFIGSHIAEALVTQGETVVVFDDFSTGHRKNLAAFQEHLEIVEGSIEDGDLLQKTLKGVDYVIHQAALPSVPRSIKTPKRSHDVNITGTLNLLLAARDQGVKRMIYASSSSVYGNQRDNDPKVETMEARPLSPYALSKYTAEQYHKLFDSIYGLETVSLRYFNVFGPRQDPNSAYAAVIPKFIEAALSGTEATIHGDGRQSRDFTYVENNVRANLMACQAPAEKVAGRAFNIACGKTISLLELLDHIEAITGKTIARTFTESRTGDVRFSLADTRAAQEAFGYEPTVDFESGLRKTIEWTMAQK